MTHTTTFAPPDPDTWVVKAVNTGDAFLYTDRWDGWYTTLTEALSDAPAGLINYNADGTWIGAS